MVNTMKFINTRVDDELYEKAREAADAERRSVSSWIRNLIEDAVSKER
jgi:predicted HicB family RNase H-like nuclease